MTAALVFAAQFLYIFLRGWQTFNVVHGHYIRAALCSLLLGLCGLFLTATIALSAVRGAHWSVWCAFLAAGPLGIVSSMWLSHRGRVQR